VTNVRPSAIAMAGLVGVLASVGVIIGLVIDPAHFFRSYLFAFLYFLGLALGSMAFVMVHHLTGGNWGVATRRILEAAMMTLPLMGLLFMPILFGLHHLYPWARPDEVAADPALRWKTPYLNSTFFIVRAALFFIGWIVFALLLRLWGRRFEDNPTRPLSVAIQKLSAGGLLVYFLFMTFAGIDWMLSRDAHYYSTIFGMIATVGQSLTGLSFAVLVVCLLSRRSPIREFVTPQILVDLGSLLETMVILYAYLAFAQFLVNWLGNSQHEITWYVRRTSHGWYWVAGLIILVHFFVPFFALLMKGIKQKPALLGGVAALLLVARLIDVFWIVAPEVQTEHPRFTIYWMDFVSVLAIGGLWSTLFLVMLNRATLIPRHSPGVEEFEESDEETGRQSSAAA